MEAYHVDMAGPDPTHEAAYSRIRRVVQGNKAFIDALVAAPPAKMVGNWKVELVKKNRDIVALRGLWARDPEFRTYLQEKMEFHFGAPYTAALIRIFMK